MSNQLGRRTLIAGSLAAAATSSAAAARPGNPLPPMPEAAPGHAPFRAAFLAWLDGAAERFAFPVAVTSDSPDHTELRIEGLHPALWFSLGHAGGIDVGVTWDDVCWDLLTCPDVYAHEQPGGSWHNMLMRPEYPLDHPSIEAAWRSDGFEPLLDWVNDELAPATHLGLWHSSPGGATWARLVWDGQAMIGGPPLQVPEHAGPPPAAARRARARHPRHPGPRRRGNSRRAAADSRRAAIGSAVQRGAHVFLYDDRGRQLAMLQAGNGDEDGLTGYTARTVTIRRGAHVFTYDQTGRQLSMAPAR